MPLVTRQVNQANVFKQDDEPSNWTNGDLWSDTDDNEVFKNVNGTATDIRRTIGEIVALG